MSERPRVVHLAVGPRLSGDEAEQAHGLLLALANAGPVVHEVAAALVNASADLPAADALAHCVEFMLWTETLDQAEYRRVLRLLNLFIGEVDTPDTDEVPF